MAYKVSLHKDCDFPRCGTKAAYRVHNRRGSGTGDKGEFCKRHADQRVRQLGSEEEKAAAAAEERVEKHAHRIRFDRAERIAREDKARLKT